MWKNITFWFVLFLLTLQPNFAQGQQQAGQIVVNTGVGYSPEFNYGISTGGIIDFPVGINNAAATQGFSSSHIVPNIGGAMDYGLTNRFCVGLASSYQSEWIGFPNFYSPPTAKITRINLTVRILFHLNKYHLHFDHYLAIRAGTNYWTDTPFANTGPDNFLLNPNSFDYSFQFVYGMRFYFNSIFGVHFEFGIGEPYLLEGGLTFRINTFKKKDKDE